MKNKIFFSIFTINYSKNFTEFFNHIQIFDYYYVLLIMSTSFYVRNPSTHVRIYLCCYSIKCVLSWLKFYRIHQLTSWFHWNTSEIHCNNHRIHWNILKLARVHSEFIETSSSKLGTPWKASWSWVWWSSSEFVLGFLVLQAYGQNLMQSGANLLEICPKFIDIYAKFVRILYDFRIIRRNKFIVFSF